MQKLKSQKSYKKSRGKFFSNWHLKMFTESTRSGDGRLLVWKNLDALVDTIMPND